MLRCLTSPFELEGNYCSFKSQLSGSNLQQCTAQVKCALTKQGQRFLTSIATTAPLDRSLTNRMISKFVSSSPKHVTLSTFLHLLSPNTANSKLSSLALPLYTRIKEAAWFTWNSELIADLIGLMYSQNHFEEAEILTFETATAIGGNKRELISFYCNLLDSHAKHKSEKGLFYTHDRLKEVIAESSSIRLKRKAFESLVGGFCIIGSPHEAERVIDDMLCLSIKPSASQFRSIVEGYGKLGLFGEMLRSVARMESEGYPLDTISSNMILSSYGDHKHLSQMVSWLRKMKSSNIVFSVRTYNSVLNSCPTIIPMSMNLKNSPTSIKHLLDCLKGDEALMVKELIGSGYLEKIIEWNGSFSKLDLHGMHLGTSYLIMLEWMEMLHFRFGSGQYETPTEIIVVCGQGKHSKTSGESPVKAMVRELMVRMRSPMRIDRKNGGCFVAKGKLVKDWLVQMFSVDGFELGSGESDCMPFVSRGFGAVNARASVEMEFTGAKK